ncbi:dUTP diphosphatase [uncultured Clostridium sp.]|uniref:dUTP diphosphatase n=1 Tax=uncultured Clostridium sp. TaxID=59620 RepID=UPI002603069F|nr:dUTP diphosphatase [uncultured Clostridium sp.]
MLISDLFQIQKNIDTTVSINEDLSDYKLTARKSLSLHIKISDLANETKCCAYTNDSDAIKDETSVLRKYVSCFQQILSIGNDNEYSISLESVDAIASDYCLSDQFLNLYIDINDLIISKSEDHFVTLCEDFLSIGLKLGYNENKIREAFKDFAS